MFHLLGNLGFCFRIPTTAHTVAFANHFGRIADNKDVLAFGSKVARDLAATGYDRSVGEDGSLAEGAAIADEDIVANADGQLAGMNSSRVEVGKEMEVGVKQLALPRKAHVVAQGDAASADNTALATEEGTFAQRKFGIWLHGEPYARMYLGAPSESDVPFVAEDDLVSVGLPGVDLDNADGYHTGGDRIADGDTTHGADLDIPRDKDGNAKGVAHREGLEVEPQRLDPVDLEEAVLHGTQALAAFVVEI